MPHYIGNYIGLYAADLKSTTTQQPWNHVGSEPTRHIKKCTEILAECAKQNRLHEEVLPDPEDSHSRIRFLGEDKDYPFFLVKASRDKASQLRRTPRQAASNGTLPDGTTNTGNDSKVAKEQHIHNVRVPSSSSTAHLESEHLVSKRVPRYSLPNSFGNAATPVLKPEALCILLELDSDCFFKLPSNQFEIKSHHQKSLDLKTDFFINGEFQGSENFPARLKKSELGTTMGFSFHGYRVGRLAEKPWLLVPLGQNADGSLRDLKRTKGGSVGTQQRYDTINEGLKKHVESFCKTDDEIGILGRYLMDVAAMPAPDELQRPGGLKFGIIDIVVSIGRGEKDGAHTFYINKPLPNRTTLLRTSYRKATLAATNRVYNFKQLPKKKSPIKLHVVPPQELNENGSHESQAMQGTATCAISPVESIDILCATSKPKAQNPVGAQTVCSSDKSHEVALSSALQQPDWPSRNLLSIRKRAHDQYAETDGLPTENSNVTKKQKMLRAHTTQETLPRLVDSPIDPDTLPRKQSSRQLSMSQPSRPPATPTPEFNLKRAKSISEQTPKIEGNKLKHKRIFSRGVTEYAWTTETTLSEEMEAVQKEAAESVHKEKLGGHGTAKTSEDATLDGTVDGAQDKRNKASPIRSYKDQRSLIVKLHFKDRTILSRFESITKPNDAESTPCTNATPLHGATMSLNHPAATLSRESLTKVDKTKKATEKPTQQKGKARVDNKNNSKGYQAPVWEPRPLSEDCIITFAKDSVRQIKSERAGAFEEQGILFGVRYILS